MTGETAWHFTVLGYPVGLGAPEWLLLGLAALAVGAIAAWAALRRRAAVRQLLGDRLGDSLAPGVETARPVVRATFTGVSLLLFSVAMGQPQCGSRAELTKKRGIDVVVALDASKSMRARDVLPSRLERAKLELSTLLDELKGDRVAIVAFAGDAFVQCPLTSDYAAAKLFLRAIDPDQMQEGGTNIGAALMTSQKVLEGADRGAKDRVVVLLSDGEDLSGEVGEATEALKATGIKVFTIGIGNSSGEPIPVFDKQGDRTGYMKDPSTGQTVLSRLDEAGLESIAQATGGEYFHRSGAVAVPEVAARIDRLQKSELESRITVRYDERFQSFLLPGLVLLLLGMLFGAPGRRRGTGAALGVGLVLLAAPARALGPFEANPPGVERGMKAYDAGRFDDALREFTAAEHEAPGHPALEYNRGNALYRLGRYDDAREAYKRASEAAVPGLKERDLYNMGNALAQLGDTKAAINAYRKALVMEPQDEQARHNLEVLLRKIPPPKSQQTSDGGTDAGRPDGGPQDGGSDGGQGDGGQSGDGGTQRGDAGSQHGADAGQADGGSKGEQQQKQGADPDAGQRPDVPDAGTAEPELLRDGGVGKTGGFDKNEAERLLDAMRQNERNLQLWRFQQKKRQRKPDEKDW
ncbi:MAG TPA: VWA domain-containing protein [Myxococcaceae bacterium]